MNYCIGFKCKYFNDIDYRDYYCELSKGKVDYGDICKHKNTKSCQYCRGTGTVNSGYSLKLSKCPICKGKGVINEKNKKS